MLNLDTYTNRTTPIQLDGKVYNVKEVTVEQWGRMIEVESLEGQEALDKQILLIAELLSNNEEKKKIKPETIQKLPKVAINALWTHFVVQSFETVNEKN